MICPEFIIAIRLYINDISISKSPEDEAALKG